MKTSLEHLERLIAFPSVSRDSNLDLVAYVTARGEESSALFSPDGCPHHSDAAPSQGK